MTTVANDRLVFVHVPKTGGTWVAGAMKAAGIHVWEEGSGWHPTTDQLDIGDRFAFAFVREPLSWWGSEWAFRRRMGYTDHPYDKWLHLEFSDFLKNVIREFPGYLTWLYSHYILPDMFVGRYESLADHLVEALTLAGQSFDEIALRRYPPINQSSDVPTCSKELYDRLVHSEHEVYSRFYSHAAEL